MAPRYDTSAFVLCLMVGLEFKLLVSGGVFPESWLEWRVPISHSQPVGGSGDRLQPALGDGGAAGGGEELSSGRAFIMDTISRWEFEPFLQKLG